MTIRRLIHVVVLVVFSAIASSASADTPVEKAFARLKAQSVQSEGYGDMVLMLSGAVHALELVNADLELKGRTPLFCRAQKSESIALSYLDITLGEFERKRSGYRDSKIFNENTNVAVVNALLDGLRATYPCK